MRVGSGFIEARRRDFSADWGSGGGGCNADFGAGVALGSGVETGSGAWLAAYLFIVIPFVFILCRPLKIS